MQTILPEQVTQYVCPIAQIFAHPSLSLTLPGEAFKSKPFSNLT